MRTRPISPPQMSPSHVLSSGRGVIPLKYSVSIPSSPVRAASPHRGRLFLAASSLVPANCCTILWWSLVLGEPLFKFLPSAALPPLSHILFLLRPTSPPSLHKNLGQQHLMRNQTNCDFSKNRGLRVRQVRPKCSSLLMPSVRRPTRRTVGKGPSPPFTNCHELILLIFCAIAEVCFGLFSAVRGL